MQDLGASGDLKAPRLHLTFEHGLFGLLVVRADDQPVAERQEVLDQRWAH